MRYSVRGINTKPSFQINQLKQKSNFSAPEQLQQKPSSSPYISQTQNKLHAETSLQDQHQHHEDPQNPTALNPSSLSSASNSQLFSSGTLQPYNHNKTLSGMTIVIYFILIIYIWYFYYLLLPSMIDSHQINKITGVALIVGLLVVVLLIVLSVEKARRLSPGYPVKLNQRYRVGNLQEAMKLKQVEHIKNYTIELLIQKAQLKQLYAKNPTSENQQKINAFQYKFFAESTKFCQRCNNIKQPRVRHCSECDRCVQRMDHHCVWLNNCVGRRNHKFFMLFMLFLVIGLTFFTVVGVMDFFVKNSQLTHLIETNHGGIIKIVHLLLLILSALLWFYYVFVFFEQIYLIANNLTFVESLSHVLSEKKPWKRDSICENFAQVFGRGCWICPTESRDSAGEFVIKHDQQKKNPSVELVEQVQVACPDENRPNFDSENQLKRQKHDI